MKKTLLQLCGWIRSTQGYAHLHHMTPEELAIYPLQDWWNRAHGIPPTARERRKAYYQARKEETRETRRLYIAERRRTNADAQIANRWRAAVGSTIRRGLAGQGLDRMTRFGCTKAEFLSHLEFNFKRGMTWENYATYWNIGHNRPVASYHLAIEGQAENAFHYSNLFPQLAGENFAAGAKWNGRNYRRAA
jgi:hypothetical protein